MITWNIDLMNYTFSELHELANVIEKIEYSIAKEIYDYLIQNHYYDH